MPVRVQCPSCERRYTLADNLIGKKIRCKDCQTVIEVKATGESARPPRDAVQAHPPALPGRKWERDDDDEEDRPRRRSKSKRNQAKQAPVLLIVGVCCGLAAAVVAGVLVWVLTSARKPEAAAPKPNRPIVAAQQPVNPVADPPKVADKAAEPEPPGLYGDQGGDPIAFADPHLPDTILRARFEDTFYKLSNPRIGQPKFGPGQALMVDYEVTRRGKHSGASLIIHGGDGRRTQVFIFRQQDRGTIEVKTFGPFGSFPKNAELYMIRGDARYGPQSPTFKVSNSVTMGVMPTTTKARNWTKEEIDRYTKEPPNYTAANVHPGVGRDTPWAGDTMGGAALRYVEPNGLLLGLEFQLGEWDKEKCIGRVVPIFKRDQPTMLAKRVIAKEGYAVVGMEVHAGKFVDGLKLLFQRIKGDASLDPADAYAGEWIGFTAAGQPKMLGNDGHRIIGIHVHQGAILNGLALVTDETPKN